MNKNFLDIEGIFLITVYLLLFTIGFNIYSSIKYSGEQKLKKFFLYGFYLKIFASIGFALIFDLYYLREGDSFYYFLNSCNLGDVFFEDFKSYIRIFLDFISNENLYTLPTGLSYIPAFKDSGVIAVHRFISPFTILGLKNYYLTIIVLNVFLYIINWRIFLFFNKIFPEKTKIFAYGFLFVPSVLFWGSGILKDSFTFTFGLVFLSNFYKIFFQRKLNILNAAKLLLAAYVVITLKPYILYSYIAGGFVWLGLNSLKVIKNRVLRVFVLPVIIVGIGFAGIYVLNSVANVVGGSYKDIDSMLNKAVVSQQDLKQEYYQGSSFDIGDYAPTFEGALSVTPAAIVVGLYRPFIFEARSVVVFLSGFENLALLLITIYVFFKAGFVGTLRIISREPFLVFCLVFSIIMAWGIGLSTSNFGALVRFKIPLMPFFLILWLFILDEYKKLEGKVKS